MKFKHFKRLLVIAMAALMLSCFGLAVAFAEGDATPAQSGNLGTPHTIQVDLKLKEPGAWSDLHTKLFDEGTAFHFDKGDVLAFSMWSPDVYANGGAECYRIGFNASMNLTGDGHMALYAKDQWGISISGSNEDIGGSERIYEHMYNGWCERFVEIPEPFCGTTLRRLDFYIQFSWYNSTSFTLYIKDLRIIHVDGSIHYMNVDDFGAPTELVQNYTHNGGPNLDTSVPDYFTSKFIDEDIVVSSIDDFELPEIAYVGDQMVVPEATYTLYNGETGSIPNGGCAVISPSVTTTWGPTNSGTYEEPGVWTFRYEKGKVDGDDSPFNRFLRCEKKVTVYPADAPRFEAPSIADGSLGTVMTLPAFPKTQGNADSTSITLADPDGKAVALDGTTFSPIMAGKYTATYSATGAGATVSHTSAFNVANNTDKVLRVTVSAVDTVASRLNPVASTVNSLGNPDFDKTVSFSVYPGAEKLALAKGDVLYYEVYSPNAGEGVGTLSFELDPSCFTGSYSPSALDELCSGYLLMDTLTDRNGYKAGRETDLSSIITKGWYAREIALPDVFVSNDNLPIEKAVINSLSIQVNSFAAYSEDLTVYYRNVKIIHADGTEYDLLADAATDEGKALKEGPVMTDMNHIYKGDDLNNWGSMYYADWTVNPLPRIDSTLVKEVKTGDEVTVEGAFEVWDSLTGSKLDSAITSIEVKAQDGTDVEITDGKFIAAKTGNYTITVHYTYYGNEYSSQYVIIGEDDEAPVINLNDDYPETLNVGERVDLINATVTDNVTVSPSYNVTVLDPDGNEVSLTLGYFRLEKAGKYTVRYTAADAAGNEAELTVTITAVAAKTDDSGCGSCSGSMAGTSVFLLLALGALGFKKRV